MEIWAVEDDQKIRDILLYTLQSTGFDCQGFEGVQDFDQAMEKATRLPDLILLDIMLPESDGMEILSKLRKNSKTAGIPVIMTTAKGTEFDKIKALEEGADDYLVKPFGMMEMVARIKAVLRRCQKNEKPQMLEWGPILLDPVGHFVSVDGKPVELTKKEFDLLELFLENPRRVLTRDELLEQVWHTDFMGETRTVDVHIRALRSKIDPYGDLIETVRKLGYRLRAPE